MRVHLYGFNLLELMVSISISSIILIFIGTSYSKLYQNFSLNISRLYLNQDINIALNMIKRDLVNAGEFGSYSLGQDLISNISILSNDNTKIKNKWQKFNSYGIGVVSYLPTDPQILSIINDSGIIADANSEILEIQYGGDDMAKFANISPAYNGSLLNKLFFNKNNLNINADRFILASSNKAYLIVTALSSSANDLVYFDTNNLFDIIQLSELKYKPDPSNNKLKILLKPDQASLMLVNFKVKYYFIATINGIKGLYARWLENNGDLSRPILISTKIIAMNFQYKINYNYNEYNQLNPKLNILQILKSSEMVNLSGVSYWNKVKVINIHLTPIDTNFQYATPRIINEAVKIRSL